MIGLKMSNNMVMMKL